jgi:uncharacterized protein
MLSAAMHLARYNGNRKRHEMSLDELLHTKREDILSIAARYGAYNVRIFGSVTRGEADEQSDIDLLVNMDSGRSLLDLCGLLIDLEELLGHKVDVVTEKGLRDRIRERVLKEAVALCEIFLNGFVISRKLSNKLLNTLIQDVSHLIRMNWCETGLYIILRLLVKLLVLFRKNSKIVIQKYLGNKSVECGTS